MLRSATRRQFEQQLAAKEASFSKREGHRLFVEVVVMPR
jgi:hypothetical protein